MILEDPVEVEIACYSITGFVLFGAYSIVVPFSGDLILIITVELDSNVLIVVYFYGFRDL